MQVKILLDFDSPHGGEFKKDTTRVVTPSYGRLLIDRKLAVEIKKKEVKDNGGK